MIPSIGVSPTRHSTAKDLTQPDGTLAGVSERILIVDDEADVVSTIAYRLQREGFETLSAATGREALELARSERPALVLLDLMLPDAPGTEVCRKLLADPVTRHIPVVMLTARADEIDRIVGLELGSSDYITKPFSPREMIARVRASLASSAVS